MAFGMGIVLVVSALAATAAKPQLITNEAITIGGVGNQYPNSGWIPMARIDMSLLMAKGMGPSSPTKRQRRSVAEPPFSLEAKCELTPAELSGLVGVLRTVNEQLQGNNTLSNVGVNQCVTTQIATGANTTLTKCQLAIEKMKAGVEHLKCEAGRLGRSAFLDKGQLEGLRRDIETQRASFQKLEDSLKGIHKRSLRNEVGKFTLALNQMELRLTGTLQQIARLEAEHAETTTLLVVAEIGRNKTKKAAQHFMKLDATNEVILTRIIGAAYDDQNPKAIEYVLNFIIELSNIYTYVRACDTLYNLMETRADFSNAAVLRFSWMATAANQRSATDPILAANSVWPPGANFNARMLLLARDQQRAETRYPTMLLAYRLDIKAMELVAGWGSRIARGDYTGIRDALQSPTYVLYVQPHISKLMQTAYNSRNNVDVLDQILPFLRSLGVGEPQFDCIEQLLRVLNLNGGINTQKALEFIDLIDTLRSAWEGLGLSANLWTKLNRIVASVPWNIMSFFMGQPCRITNAHTNLHLTSFSIKKDGDRRYVFMTSVSPIREWKFLSQDNGKYFYIKNTVYNEYMFAPITHFRYDDWRRLVFTWVPGDYDNDRRGRWLIEPNGDYFEIKNQVFGEYLYSSSHSSHLFFPYPFKFPFTWIPGNRIVEGKWKFDC